MSYNTRFDITDTDELLEIVRQHPLATLVFQEQSRINVTHVPLTQETVGGLRFIGHLSRLNPAVSQSRRENVLAIFHGPDAYISPSWYPSKQSNGGKVVPTWDYVVVHVRGTLSTSTEPQRILHAVTTLTDFQEARRDFPWGVHDAPKEHTDRLLRELVGIEMEVLEISGTAKVSQNVSPTDREGVVSELNASGQDALVEYIQRYGPRWQ